MPTQAPDTRELVRGLQAGRCIAVEEHHASRSGPHKTGSARGGAASDDPTHNTDTTTSSGASTTHDSTTTHDDGDEH